MWIPLSKNKATELVCRYLNGDKSAYTELGQLLKKEHPLKNNSKTRGAFDYGKRWSLVAGKDKEWGNNA